MIPSGPATPDDPVIIYTDGACIGNPGPGGWGAVISRGSRRLELSGSVQRETTNNRMELAAAIEAMKALKKPLPVRIYSDSTYLVDGARKWLRGWKLKNWHKVKNPDLWKEIDRLKSIHQIEWVWVRGHDGNAGNERADYLANRAANVAAT